MNKLIITLLILILAIASINLAIQFFDRSSGFEFAPESTYDESTSNEDINLSEVISSSYKVTGYELILPVRNKDKMHLIIKTEGPRYDTCDIPFDECSRVIAVLKEPDALYNFNTNRLIVISDNIKIDSLHLNPAIQ